MAGSSVRRGVSYGFAQIRDQVFLFVLSFVLITIGVLGIVSFSMETILIGALFILGGLLILYAGAIGLFYAMIEDAVRNGIHGSILASDANTEVLVKAVAEGINQSELMETDGNPSMSISEQIESSPTEQTKDPPNMNSRTESGSTDRTQLKILDGCHEDFSNRQEDALEDVVSHISEVGPVTTSNIQTIFYQQYPLDFEHAGSWREEFLIPSLKKFPNIQYSDENGTWEYSEDRSDEDA